VYKICDFAITTIKIFPQTGNLKICTYMQNEELTVEMKTTGNP
jgi:hypothetical protein